MSRFDTNKNSGPADQDTPDEKLPRESFIQRLFPPDGYLSAIFNLTSTSIGAGILGLPSAFAFSGLLIASMYLLIMAIFALFSNYLLAVVAKKCGSPSYEAMSQAVLGRWGKYISMFSMFLCAFGACVAYVVMIDKLLTPILSDPSVKGFWHTKGAMKLCQFLIWLCLYLPVSLPKKIAALRHVSLLGVGFMLFFMLTLTIRSVQSGFAEMGKSVKMSSSGNQSIAGVGIFCFAYINQISVVKIFTEMSTPSVRKLTIEASYSTALTMFLYWMTGFMGYAQFGEKVKSSVLLMFMPQKDPLIAISYFGIMVKLIASFGLLNLATRTTVYFFLGWDAETIASWKHILVSFIASASAMVIGISYPNINVVFGLVGGISGGFLSYILPSLCYMYAGNFSLKEVGWMRYLLTYVLLFSGVVALVFSTCSAIYSFTTGR